jgi:hypothetical protein
MKRRATAKKSKTKTPTKRHTDRIALELAEVRARKIPAKDLVWNFRLTAANIARLETAVRACVECLTAEFGNRQRVATETATVGRRSLQEFILKLPKVTPALLRRLDDRLAECCRRTKVTYRALSYGEDVHKSIAWKTLGAVLQPKVEAAGDLDCRELRFDGLYRHATGDTSAYYMRFYPNGQWMFVSVSDGEARDVARWFSRDWKWATMGTYKVNGPSLSAELPRSGAQDEAAVAMRLTGRLTRQGLKVREWNSQTNRESQREFAFCNVTLK